MLNRCGGRNTNTDLLVIFSHIIKLILTSINRMAGAGPVESREGSVGYAPCRERILTFSCSMGMEFHPPTQGTNYQGLRVVFLHGFDDRRAKRNSQKAMRTAEH